MYFRYYETATRFCLLEKDLELNRCHGFMLTVVFDKSL